MAANDTGDDITIGQTNKGEDGTELVGQQSKEGGFGNDYVLLLTQSPLINRTAVDGLKSIAIKQGRGVVGQADAIAGVFGSCLGSGKGDIGVRGENNWVDTPGHLGEGVGVLGTVKLRNGVGVRGENTASAQPGIAIVGESSVGTAVQGISHGFSGVGVEGLANAGDEGTGVHGEADGALGVGVSGVSGRGTGVSGSSTGGVGGAFSAGGGLQSGDAPPGRAGVFGSDSAAQVRLVPHKTLNPPTSNQPYAVQTLITTGQETAFPANGQTGDLLCTTLLVQPSAGGPPSEIAALWFCEKGGVDKAHPAQWRQVLFGPAFSGQG